MVQIQISIDLNRIPPVRVDVLARADATAAELGLAKAIRGGVDKIIDFWAKETGEELYINQKDEEE